MAIGFFFCVFLKDICDVLNSRGIFASLCKYTSTVSALSQLSVHRRSSGHMHTQLR